MMYRQNGEMLAVAFPTATKGYDSKTRLVPTSTMKTSYKNPNVKEALTPYDWNALRNRIEPTFDNAPKPRLRFCHPRNVSSVPYSITQGHKEPGFNMYRTTHQNFFSKAAVEYIPNDTNQGIVSEKAKMIHIEQLM